MFFPDRHIKKTHLPAFYLMYRAGRRYCSPKLEGRLKQHKSGRLVVRWEYYYKEIT